MARVTKDFAVEIVSARANGPAKWLSKYPTYENSDISREANT